MNNPAPQNVDELMVQFGEYILVESMKAIGEEKHIDMVKARAPRNAHVAAAQAAKVAFKIPLHAVTALAQRARAELNGDDTRKVYASIMSDMLQNRNSVKEAFAVEPLGYFAELFRDLPHDANYMKNVLDAIIEYGEEG